MSEMICKKRKIMFCNQAEDTNHIPLKLFYTKLMILFSDNLLTSFENLDISKSVEKYSVGFGSDMKGFVLESC